MSARTFRREAKRRPFHRRVLPPHAAPLVRRTYAGVPTRIESRNNQRTVFPHRPTLGRTKRLGKQDQQTLVSRTMFLSERGKIGCLPRLASTAYKLRL